MSNEIHVPDETIAAIAAELQRQRDEGPKYRDEHVTDREHRYVDAALLPVEDDRHRVLNPKKVPRWLLKATEGRYVMFPDGGRPQICRFWDYIDWPSVIRAQGSRMVADDTCWATSAALEAVEDARARGYEAHADVGLWFEGWTRMRRPKFSIDIWGVMIEAALPRSEAARYTDLFRAEHHRHGLEGQINYRYKSLAADDLTRTAEPLEALCHENSKHRNEHYWIFC